MNLYNTMDNTYFDNQLVSQYLWYYQNAISMYGKNVFPLVKVNDTYRAYTTLHFGPDLCSVSFLLQCDIEMLEHIDISLFNDTIPMSISIPKGSQIDICIGKLLDHQYVVLLMDITMNYNWIVSQVYSQKFKSKNTFYNLINKISNKLNEIICEPSCDDSDDDHNIYENYESNIHDPLYGVNVSELLEKRDEPLDPDDFIEGDHKYNQDNMKNDMKNDIKNNNIIESIVKYNPKNDNKNDNIIIDIKPEESDYDVAVKKAEDIMKLDQKLELFIDNTNVETQDVHIDIPQITNEVKNEDIKIDMPLVDRDQNDSLMDEYVLIDEDDQDQDV